MYVLQAEQHDIVAVEPYGALGPPCGSELDDTVESCKSSD